MRWFNETYLNYSRRGLWTHSRDSLTTLNLGEHMRLLDVGAGDGALTQVLVEECAGSTEIVAIDYDRTLLTENRSHDRVQGDANMLPFRSNTFGLVVCQTLLVNMYNPHEVVSEFVRLAETQVGAIEPDNSAVTVKSTVRDEAAIDRAAREAMMNGSVTNMAIGGDGTEAVFNRAGLEKVTSAPFIFEKTVEPPYSPEDLTSARLKAAGTRIDDGKEIMAAGHLTGAEIEELRDQVRQIGRCVVDQMLDGTYRRYEWIPFYVTTGYIRRD